MAERDRQRSGAAREKRFAPPVYLQTLTFAFLGLVLLTLLGPFMTFNNPATSGTGSPLRQGLYLLVCLTALVGLRPWADPARLLPVPLPLTIALAWCAASLLWAIEPGIAVRRLVLTAGIIWAIFATVPRLGYDRTVLLLRVMLALSVVASFLAVFAWPAFGIHQIDESYDKALIGDWRGIFLHKNIAGAVSALTVIAFAFDQRTMPRAVQVAVIAMAAVFLWFSGSRTSLGVCAIALLAGLLFLRYQSRNRLLVLGLTCFVALAGSVFLNIYNDPLLRHTQDPTAFTGRTQIWQVLGRYSADSPLGSGYGSFWNIGPDSPVFDYATGWVTEVAEGHNGFLDLMATIGVPGLLIVIVTLIIWPLTRLFASSAAIGGRGALILATVVFCIAHNGTESSLLDRDQVVNVLLMIALALLWTVTARDARRPAARPSGSPGTRRPGVSPLRL
jgi:exopolysaccharide production protein ExoQ